MSKIVEELPLVHRFHSGFFPVIFKFLGSRLYLKILFIYLFFILACFLIAWRVFLFTAQDQPIAPVLDCRE